MQRGTHAACVQRLLRVPIAFVWLYLRNSMTCVRQTNSPPNLKHEILHSVTRNTRPSDPKQRDFLENPSRTEEKSKINFTVWGPVFKNLIFGNSRLWDGVLLRVYVYSSILRVLLIRICSLRSFRFESYGFCIEFLISDHPKQ